MNAFGIASQRRFTMWDWVGGRYSVWSAVGLVAEIVLGTAQWEQLLAGASEVDAHFASVPLERNVPAIAGLIS